MSQRTIATRAFRGIVVLAALMHGPAALLTALLLVAVWPPRRGADVAGRAERVDLNALLDAVQGDLMRRVDAVHANLTHGFEATCAECHSGAVAHEPCQLCRDPRFQPDPRFVMA